MYTEVKNTKTDVRLKSSGKLIAVSYSFCDNSYAKYSFPEILTLCSLNSWVMRNNWLVLILSNVYNLRPTQSRAMLMNTDSPNSRYFEIKINTKKIKRSSRTVFFSAFLSGVIIIIFIFLVCDRQTTFVMRLHLEQKRSGSLFG